MPDIMKRKFLEEQERNRQLELTRQAAEMNAQQDLAQREAQQKAQEFKRAGEQAAAQKRAAELTAQQDLAQREAQQKAQEFQRAGEQAAAQKRAAELTAQQDLVQREAQQKAQEFKRAGEQAAAQKRAAELTVQQDLAWREAQQKAQEFKRAGEAAAAQMRVEQAKARQAAIPPPHPYASHMDQWEALKIHASSPEVNMATPYGTPTELYYQEYGKPDWMIKDDEADRQRTMRSNPPLLAVDSAAKPADDSVLKQNQEWFDHYSTLLMIYDQSYDGQMKYRKLCEIKGRADSANIAAQDLLEYVDDTRVMIPWMKELDIREWEENGKEQTTAIRPFSQLLHVYRTGGQMNEAETDIMYSYDKAHPGLLGGTEKYKTNYVFMTFDSRKKLGETAYNALKAADSPLITQAESDALIASIGEDMDAMSGKYATLEEYYASNPRRAQELQSIVGLQKDRQVQEDARAEAEYQTGVFYFQEATKITLYEYANGGELNDDQKSLIEYLKSSPLTDVDYNDPAYIKAQEALMNVSYEEASLRDNSYQQYTDVTFNMEFKREALEALDFDLRFAKAAGLTLTQLYDMFPEMRKDPDDMIDYARKAVEQKWDSENAQGILEWLFGAKATGEGVGAGTTVLKGVGVGGREFAQGFIGFWHNYITYQDEEAILAWNRGNYTGADGRMRASRDFDAAIAKITDPVRRAYWENYKASVKDILDLPFNFADEKTLNALYENQKSIDFWKEYMVTNGNELEYALFSLAAAGTENGLAFAAAAGIGAITGNPFAGTAIAFGLPAASQTSDLSQAAGIDRKLSNLIGLGTLGISAVTERIPLESYFVKGSAAHLKAVAVKGGASKARQIAGQLMTSTMYMGERLATNAGVEMTQETFESILTDVYLNAVGAQDKNGEAIIDDASRAAVLAAILSPLFSGQAKLMTAAGDMVITPAMQKWGIAFYRKKLLECMQNPQAVEKVMEANAAANTVETLIKGGAPENSAKTAFDQAKKETGAAEQKVAEAEGAYHNAAGEYLSVMQEDMQNGGLMTDAEHDMYLQFVVNGKKVMDSAKETFAVWSERLKTLKEDLNKLFSGLMATARADGREKAQADIQSEMDAMRKGAGAQTELPAPENVSIDGNPAGNDASPLAQNDGSDIMNEGAQGEAVNGDGDARTSIALMSVRPEGIAIYSANGDPAIRSLRRPIFDSMLNDGFEVDGNQFRLNNHAYNALFKSQRKDIMPVDICDALRVQPVPGNLGSVQYVNPATGTTVFVNPVTKEIVGIWPNGFIK